MQKIKRLSIFLSAFISIFALRGDVFAAEKTSLLDAKVFVEQIFTISANPLSIDFGKIDPSPSDGPEELNTTDVKELKFHCATNNNNPWEVSIVWLSPLTSDTFTIPNENFLWRGKSTGFGTFHKVAGHLDTNPIVFYSSSNEEFITAAPIEFTFQFKIQIPENQAAGTYSTTMAVTMKDTSTNHEVTADPINFNLEVNPRVTMSISPTNLDFGTVRPGKASEAGLLSITCSSNTGNVWNLSMYAVSELSSEGFTIPNENFHWSVSQTGYGETGYGRINRTMTTAPYIFYQSSGGFALVNFSLAFNVSLPPTQPRGKYTTTLIFTMTELEAHIVPLPLSP